MADFYFSVYVNSTKLDWEGKKYLLTNINSSVIPTPGSRFAYSIRKGICDETFWFRVTEVFYSARKNFNDKRLANETSYIAMVYVEPDEDAATKERIQYLKED